MRNCARSLALAAAVLGLVAALPAMAGAADVPVFILAGQSNMDGRGQTSQIAGIRPALNVTQSSGNDKVEISYNGYQSVGSFAWMRPGNSGGNEGAGGANEFGCELSLGQDLAHNVFPSQTVYMVKVSHGGTTLAGDWKPGTGTNFATGAGGDWNELVNNVNAAVATIKAQGDNPVLEGFFWHQGESDGQNLTNAQNYDAHLRTFIADIRSVFNVPNLPFFVGSMGNITDSGYPYDNTYIYNAQKAVCVSLGSAGGINYSQDVDLTYDPAGYNPTANTYFVNLNDLPNNGLHFSAAGLIPMGDRFEQTFALVTPEPATVALLGLGIAGVAGLRKRRRTA